MRTSAEILEYGNRMTGHGRNKSGQVRSYLRKNRPLLDERTGLGHPAETYSLVFVRGRHSGGRWRRPRFTPIESRGTIVSRWDRVAGLGPESTI